MGDYLERSFSSPAAVGELKAFLNTWVIKNVLRENINQDQVLIPSSGLGPRTFPNSPRNGLRRPPVQLPPPHIHVCIEDDLLQISCSWSAQPETVVASAAAESGGNAITITTPTTPNTTPPPQPPQNGKGKDKNNKTKDPHKRSSFSKMVWWGGKSNKIRESPWRDANGEDAPAEDRENLIGESHDEVHHDNHHDDDDDDDEHTTTFFDLFASMPKRNKKKRLEKEQKQRQQKQQQRLEQQQQQQQQQEQQQQQLE